ncbi:hypothetical protein ACFRH4_03500 [Streptomyces mirabilis]|uniref:hypothetical protein n=1 Tax=Streptomyces mirabilis TaxID=68239 RepID=UPI0036B09F5D
MTSERAGTGSPDWAYNWADGTGLLGMDQPGEIDAAFERGEPHVGVAVIGLALNHSDPVAILPRIAHALRSDAEELRPDLSPHGSSCPKPLHRPDIRIVHKVNHARLQNPV